MPTDLRTRSCVLVLAALVALPVGAQPPVPAPSPVTPTPEIQEPPPATLPPEEVPDDPWDAYHAGYYDRALEGFTDLGVERPEDPEVQLNLGSAHYQMRNYPEADRAFSSATLSSDPAVRAQAFYGLGSGAYRQGRLDEAVELFKEVLEIDPDDEDAKYNLEFVRDEIRRRQEEAEKRQKEQQQEEQNQDQQEQKQEEQQGGEQEQQGNEQGENAPDSDRDGIPDTTEREGENPTDPANPDTDGDGLMDGQEDQNRNGRLDEGETDPNQADSDGDGVPDGAQAQPQEPGELPEGLTPEEAERYLQALGEDRPPLRPHPAGREAKRDKDW